MADYEKGRYGICRPKCGHENSPKLFNFYIDYDDNKTNRVKVNYECESCNEKFIEDDLQDKLLPLVTHMTEMQQLQQKYEEAKRYLDNKI